MTTWWKAGLCFVLCLVAGCASAAEDPPNVVAKLRFRDVDLVITRAETSPRFTIKDRSGTSLATDLEEGSLRTHYPDLYSAYRFGYARGPLLDARLDRRRENCRSLDGL